MWIVLKNLKENIPGKEKKGKGKVITRRKKSKNERKNRRKNWEENW